MQAFKIELMYCTQKDIEIELMYCTQKDIEIDIGLPTLISLTDDTQSGVVNSAIVNKYIEEEESYINSYISGIYQLPITAPEGLKILKQIETTLVICDLYRRGVGLNYPNTLDIRHQEAISDLVKIQKGLIKLETTKAKDNVHNYKVSNRKRLININDVF